MRTYPPRRAPRDTDALGPVALLAAFALVAVVLAVLVAATGPAVAITSGAMTLVPLTGASAGALLAAVVVTLAIAASHGVGDSDRVKQPCAINWLAATA